MEKTYVFFYDTPLEHYVADAFVVRCFDNRFWKLFKKFIKELGLNNIDVESVAGGAKIFSSPEKEEDRNFMMRELEKSIRLHKTRRIMLFTHHDCGAYGGFAQFNNNEEKEFEFNASEHTKAVEFIHLKFPDIPIDTYFIDKSGIVKTS